MPSRNDPPRLRRKFAPSPRARPLRSRAGSLTDQRVAEARDFGAELRRLLKEHREWTTLQRKGDPRAGAYLAHYEGVLAELLGLVERRWRSLERFARYWPAAHYADAVLAVERLLMRMDEVGFANLFDAPPSDDDVVFALDILRVSLGDLRNVILHRHVRATFGLADPGRTPNSREAAVLVLEALGFGSTATIYRRLADYRGRFHTDV